MEDDPPSPAPPHTEVEADGERIAGIMAGKPGTPPAWPPYISVENADDACARAEGLGARVLVPLMELRPKNCRVCVLADPAGAVFALRGP